MHLVEILLPVCDNRGARFDAHKFTQIRSELTDRFGGVTAFTRAPAQGSVETGGEVMHDDIFVLEVMTDRLDRVWWAAYRKELEREFAQDEIVIRASEIVRL